MKFNIKKGNHRSVLFRPRFHYGKTELSFSASFSESCVYNIGGEDQEDINKLYGLSFGYHHNNSIRFGWNCVGEFISLHAYWYNNGQRGSREMLISFWKKELFFNIHIDRMRDRVVMFVEAGGANDTKTTWIPFDFSKCPKWGYYLYPYFGDNQVAPHDMSIEIKEI